MFRVSYLKIGAVDYAVVSMNPLAMDDPDAQISGEIDQDACVIRVSDRVSPQRAVIIAWHEIVHAILDNAGHYDADEGMIDALAHGLFAFVYDNAMWIGEAQEIAGRVRFAESDAILRQAFVPLIGENVP